MGDGLRVMLVDDNDDFRLVATRILAKAGIRVVAEAISGQDALTQLDSMETLPDVVVLDQLMPGPSGVEVAERLHGDGRGLCIVLLTATMVDRRLRLRAADAGVAAVLSKTNVELLPDSLIGCHREHVAERR